MKLERSWVWVWIYAASVLFFFLLGLAIGWSTGGSAMSGVQFGLSLVVWGAHWDYHHVRPHRIGRHAGHHAPGKKEPALTLLRSGGALWLTNVLVFAQWYRRLDGDGPTEREAQHEFGSRSFVFPQMQIEKIEREKFGVDTWRAGFVDYLFIAFTTSSTFGPTDTPVLTPWAKLLTMTQALISLTIMVLLISRAVGVL